ncbi:MAG TPA: hypothetical protein EYG93_05725 [Sulfurospirillum arcachonense]|nr:hypothetical protein [Sulfurospirillum arcachonense]
MGCEVNLEQKTYTAPTIDFDTWSQQKLSIIKDLINQKVDTITKPTVIVFEIGHFMLPCEDKNLDWAFKNVAFADALAGKIIKKYKRNIKLLPTLLVNNLDSSQEDESQKTLEEMFQNNRFISLKSLKTLSERNLKNRAYKSLKKNQALADSFIKIDGKAYLKDEDYQHDLAAGFVDEDGNIIPRCGLILTSFLDKIAEFSKVRMYPETNYEVIFVSFSQEYHEYERVKLGVDIYASTHSDITITPIVMHWGYAIDQCYISHRNSDEKLWQTIE